MLHYCLHTHINTATQTGKLTYRQTDYLKSPSKWLKTSVNSQKCSKRPKISKKEPKTRLKLKVFSLEILILLIWTNVPRTNFASSNVVVTVVICCTVSTGPTCQFRFVCLSVCLFVCLSCLFFKASNWMIYWLLTVVLATYLSD